MGYYKTFLNSNLNNIQSRYVNEVRIIQNELLDKCNLVT